MAYREGVGRRRLALTLPLALVSVAACSLTSLDGFTGGGGSSGGGDTPAADGGREAGAASRDGATNEGGTTPVDDAYRAAVLADGPSAYFRFEGDARDETGRVVATPQDSAAIAWGSAGAVGQAVRLSGGSFDLGDVFDFSGRAEFTLEAWVQFEPSTVDYGTIFAKRDYAAGGRPSSGWLIYLFQPEMKLAFEFWRNQALTGLASIDTLPSSFGSGFHHVVVTSTRRGDGIDYALYLDGALAVTDPGRTIEQPDVANTLAIGANWRGLLDEAAIYERALTPERIRAHQDAAGR